MKRIGWVVMALMMALVLTDARPATGEDKAKARQAYRRGAQHYDLGEYREALANFKEAYREYEEPTFLFNIAQCHRQLNEHELAIRFYRTYLNRLPGAPNREEVRTTIAKLELTMAEEKAAKSAPPQGTMPAPEAGHAAAPEPAVAAPSPAPAASVEVVAAPPRKTPVYKKWWLWTTIGVVVAAGVGVGLGVGLTRDRTPSASTDLGTYRPAF
jgi:tetratricopeptide (TPR) repeat protein